MRTAIFGAGGVGGYFGGLLAQAGHEVSFIARGEHLRALQEAGLRVNSVNGDFTIRPARATDTPAEIGPVDYVVVAVKQYSLREAAPQIRPLVGPETTVVPLLNGVDAHQPLIEAVGAGPVVGGLCSLVSLVEAPGVIRQESKLRRVVVGELDRRKSDRVERLVRAWAAAGAEAIHAEDILVALWTKFVFIASFGGVTSLTRCNAGELLASRETRELFVEAMREVEAVARARHIELAPDAVEKGLSIAVAFEPTATSSMQRDVAAGKPFELEAFSGTVVRLGEQAGVATPMHQMLYGLLKPAVLKAMA
ncbi:MAG TPA: 2-dehydropantoate 2-reductase [Anaerolineales bacterium]|nr:2-dehydropantoate 2-reductase [Anaerolineales bacterium]